MKIMRWFYICAFISTVSLFCTNGKWPVSYAGESFQTPGFIQKSETSPCDWNYWNFPKTQRIQSPDFSETGAVITLSSGPAADDFLCTQTGPIHYIHIWGSLINETLSASEPGIAAFQLNIYEDIPWGFGKTYYATSTNGGESFSRDLTIISTPDRQLNPVLSVDNQGTIHVAWENYANGFDLADIYYTNKTSDQKSFLPPIMVDDAVTTTTHQRKPAMAVVESNVCLVWEDFREDPDRSRIYYSISSDRGQTFDEDFAISDGTDRQVNPSVSIDAQGTIHVVWENYTGDMKSADIYYARKEAGEAAFHAPQMVDDPITYTTHQSHPKLALHGQNIYVVWEDRRNDPLRSQIFCSWSTDGGQTFSDDVSVFPGTDLQMNPVLAVDDNGTLHVVCERFLDSLTADIYHAQKASGQSAFTLPGMVDDPVTTTTHQTRPAIAIYNNDVFVTWEDYRDNPSLAGIYFSRSRNMEFSMDIMIDDPVTLTSHQISPNLVVDSHGTIHAVWQDYRTDGMVETDGKFGPLLWSGKFEPGQYTVRGPIRTLNGLKSPTTASLTSAETEIYQYIFCTTENPFIQQEGKTYWLEVIAIEPSAGGLSEQSSTVPEVAFAWSTTSPQFHWRNPAIQWTDGGQPLPLSYAQQHSYSGQFLDLAFVIGGLVEGSAHYDFGDAPDSSVSPMLAYPESNVQAHFPTIFKSGSPPYGPIHHNPQSYVYLGESVTLEDGANVGVDEDAGNNLEVPNDIPDQDGGDDGINLFSNLPSCGYARLEYVVNVVDSPHQYFYINVWFDWNRDGDWDDTIVCPDGVTVREWAVQNEELYIYDSGTDTLTTPSFRCWHPSEEGKPESMWMRITLSDRKPPSSVGWNKIGYGGSGPAAGYEFGETEDYLLYP